MKMSREAFMGVSRKAGAFDAKALVFQDKMVMKGGLGDHTYLPDAMHASPPVPSMALAREEAEIVMFTAVRDALAAANLRATDVDCVVVNCSLFNPTPSLAAMLVNHFKMRSDVVSYSLSGMGCSAGVISIALARELLQTYKNSTCLVVATVRSFFFFLFRVFSFRFLFFQSFSLFLSSSLTLLSRSLSFFSPEKQKHNESQENITQNWYFGNERSMLIPNCLFRVGGAAIVLSNKPQDARRAKYRLVSMLHKLREKEERERKRRKTERERRRKKKKTHSKSLKKNIFSSFFRTTSCAPTWAPPTPATSASTSTRTRLERSASTSART